MGIVGVMLKMNFNSENLQLNENAAFLLEIKINFKNPLKIWKI